MAKLPPPPKRAPSGFLLYVGEFYRNLREMNYEIHGVPLDGVYSTTVIARFWRGLPGEHRQIYRDRALLGQARYQAELQTWMRTRRAMLRPSTTYIMFLKDYCRQNPNLTFKQRVAQTRKAWNALDETQKGRYRLRLQRVLQGWRKEREEVVRTDRPVNINWMRDLLAQMDREEVENAQVQVEADPHPAEGEDIGDVSEDEAVEEDEIRAVEDE